MKPGNFTEIDRATLESCPAWKWFTWRDIDFRIERKAWRLFRLMGFGLLEHRAKDNNQTCPHCGAEITVIGSIFTTDEFKVKPEAIEAIGVEKAKKLWPIFTEVYAG